MGSSHASIAASVARHYNELDPFYRDIWGEHLHHGLWSSGHESPERAVEQLIEHVAGALHLRPRDVIVDVGAGYGGTVRYLAAQHNVRVTGYTLSAAQFAFAERATADPRARVLLQDWLTNGLADQSVDAILAIESTEHMADLPLALSEMRRVLRPGGRVAVCAWLAGDRPSAWQRRWLLEPTRREGRLATLVTTSAYESLLRDAGFADVTSEDLTAAVSRTWTVSLRRLAWRSVSDSRYLRYVIGRKSSERAFIPAMFRIATAYATGAMRYAMFVGRR